MKKYLNTIWTAVFVLLILYLLCGCAMFRKPGISAPGVTVTGPKDAGKPATLDTATSVASLPIPAGSTLVVTKTEAVAAVPERQIAAQPAKEIVEVKLAAASEYRKTENTMKADTGTVDTTLAKHKIDVAENRYLLFAAIGAAVAAGLFVYIKYPTPALMCGAASVVFFLAWKLADLPSYFWVIGAVAAAGSFFLWRGHERGEKSTITP